MRTIVVGTAALCGAVLLFVACGSDQPPVAPGDYVPITCSATVRRCKEGIPPGGSTCPNNDYTDPEQAGAFATNVICQPLDESALAACTAAMCSNCIAPSCIDCEATASTSVPGGYSCGHPIQGGGTGGPGDADAGELPPPFTGGYSVRGYEISTSGLADSPDYDSGFDPALGIPADISAIEDLFFAEQTTAPTVGGLSFSFGTSGGGGGTSVSLDFNSTLSSTALPYTLNAFVLPGGARAPTTFDGFVGASFETDWYAFNKGSPTLHLQIPLSGQVTAWSAAPFFDVLDEKNAAIATVLENDIVSVDYSLATAGQRVRGIVQTVGTPTGVTDGLDNVWAVTKNPNQFIRYVAPTLAQPLAIALDASPVAVAGAKLATGTTSVCSGPPPVDPYYIVVAEVTSTGDGDIRSFNQGNPQSTPIVRTFDGAPVALAVASITGVEYAFVATRNPNRVYQIDVAHPTVTDSFISLTDVEPVRITLGGTSGSVPAGSGPPECDLTDECLSCMSPLSSGTAFVHVLVKNP